eukprot:TRINITY_DN38089_c0_g1_i1.p2 TRINITY_DN38089_c0_g1~~TRINITY_DN38089_c0_g1_i1.p2  ORF type:complete len:120 (-),score=24.22 TRINITY_DN38089_c0_g1_i1:32-391(-)
MYYKVVIITKLKQEVQMSVKEDVLKIFIDSEEPLRPGQVIEALNIDKSEVDKAIKELKKEEKIYSPKRCFYTSKTVSYTHLTLPTILLVQISVVAVSLKKKNKKRIQKTKADKQKTRKQ